MITTQPIRAIHGCAMRYLLSRLIPVRFDTTAQDGRRWSWWQWRDRVWACR